MAWAADMRMRDSSVWAVVLAAGGARRFGRPKLLMRPDGTPLLRRVTLDVLDAVGPRCVVVLGARASRHRLALTRLPVTVVLNHRWRLGQASSLAAGFRAVPLSAPRILVVLADQVAVEPRDLRRLLQASERARGVPVASSYGTIVGAPAVIPRCLRGRVHVLKGDTGLRELLRDPRQRTVAVPLPSAALDVDRPRDYQPARLRQLRLRTSDASASGWRR
jgi:molybdenum cofactor cytidylyltransferase